MRRMEPQPSELPIIDVNLKSVEKRDYTWFFHFTDNVSVLTEQLWRLRHHGRIEVTSSDHGERFGPPAPLDARPEGVSAVGDLPVTETRIDALTGALFIAFPAEAQPGCLHHSATS